MRASGIGSFPGTTQPDFDEALAVVLGEAGADEHGLPYLPEVPGRGTPGEEDRGFDTAPGQRECGRAGLGRRRHLRRVGPLTSERA